MTKIVMSHRRSDSDAIAGHIRDRLAEDFGDASIVMGIENVPFGTDFRRHIAGALPSWDVVVAVVGPGWLGSGRGVWDENDPVHIVLDSALTSDIPVIPVLVNGAEMPAPSDLPESLQDLAFLNAIHVDSGHDFHSNMDRLVRSIEQMLAQRADRPKTAIAASPARAQGGAPSPYATADLEELTPSYGAPMQRHGLSPVVVIVAVGILVIGIGAALLALGYPRPGQTPSTVETSPKTVTTVPVAMPAPPGCPSNVPLPTLDEANIPDPGEALTGTLTSAITGWLRCSAVSFERMAGIFASISLVVPYHVSDAACFQGDKRIVSVNWPDHKDWADRQGREDLLSASLQRTIGQAVGCLPPGRQGLFYADIARAFTAATWREPIYTFTNPMLRGHRIDRCLYFGRECNEPAAFAWCRRFGFTRLAKWEWVYFIPTVSLGDGAACSKKGCAAFSVVSCVR